jgi:AraC family transcriptional regulator, transcriptional activator of pobA
MDSFTDIHVFTLPGLTSQGRWRLQSLQSRTDHVYLWITRGQGQIRVGKTMRGFGPNSVLFIPAGQTHAVIPSANAQGYVGFLPESLPVPVSHHPALIKANSIFDQAQMTGYYEQISLENNAPDIGSEHVIESYLTLISVWIERHQPRNDWAEPNRPSAAQRLADTFLRRLEDNHKMGLTVSTYAAVLGVTPTHLSRVCREVFNLPASDLIQARVILSAKYALADGEHKISSIASDLGFSSAAYFTRLFRQLSGLSPREFRLQARGRSIQSGTNSLRTN